jgi:hypothetical protein
MLLVDLNGKVYFPTGTRFCRVKEFNPHVLQHASDVQSSLCLVVTCKSESTVVLNQSFELGPKMESVPTHVMADESRVFLDA